MMTVTAEEINDFLYSFFFFFFGCSPDGSRMGGGVCVGGVTVDLDCLLQLWIEKISPGAVIV